MYSILIVDDEVMICKGIKSLIEYINIPKITKILTAYNAIEAEKIARNEIPNIIITDIKMPGINGIELIKRLIRNDPDNHCRFIVLSGYDDFHYVKDAFKIGVRDYLLKPASTRELKDVILKVIQEIEEEKERAQIEQVREYNYSKALLENNLNKIFNTPFKDEKTIKKILDDIYIEFPHNYFCIGMFEFIEGDIKASTDVELQQKLNRDYLWTETTGDVILYSFFNYKGNLILLFNFKENRYYEDRLKPLIYEIAQSIFDSNNYKAFISISEPKKGLRGLYFTYQDAMEALRYKILYNPGEIIEYKHTVNRLEKHILSEADTKRFSKNIYEFNMRELSNFIDATFSEKLLENVSIDSIKESYDTLIYVIDNIMRDCGETPYTPDEDFEKLNSLKDIRIDVKSRINNALNLLKEKWECRTTDDIVRKYIEDNYFKSIRMAEVANMVGMSYNYFSRFFREATGMNFSEYVTHIRMEKAREMLDDPTIKVHEVSRKVGYENPKHFTRVFKSYYGISPKEYQDGYWVKRYTDNREGSINDKKA